MIELFVYGTLRRGAPSHDRVAGADFIEETSTLPSYTLCSFGWYPGLVEGGSTAVVGEVYRISEERMSELDGYEGPWFRRGTVALASGRTAVVYLADPEIADGRPTIETGDFLAWTSS